MSMDQLKSDLKESLATVKKLDPITTSSADLVRHFKDTLWPTVEAIVDEMTEMDDAIAEAADIAAGMGDQLTEDTGAVFAGIITAGLAIAGELEKRAGDDAALKSAIQQFRELAKEGAEVLDGIVVPDDGDEDGDETDDEEDAGDH